MRFAAVAVAALLLAPSLAHAQSAKERLKARIRGKSRPPPAASSLGNAKEEPSPKAAPAARTRATEADLSLLRALESAFEPAPREIRVIAVEDLALLQDPRALNALAHLILDPDPEVAEAAVRTVGHFRHPRAEEILGNVIRHPGLAVPLKVAATKALPFQDTASSRELLSDLANGSRQAQPVRRAAREAIALMVPEGRGR